MFITVEKQHPESTYREWFFLRESGGQIGWTPLPEHATKFSSHAEAAKYIEKNKVDGGFGAISKVTIEEKVYKYHQWWY